MFIGNFQGTYERPSTAETLNIIKVCSNESTSQGCDDVCVFPNWQKASCCPPSACGTGDGGI